MAELKIKADSGGGTVSLKGPATTTSNAAVQLTLPVDDGDANQYLKTDGSGALSWATVSSDVVDDTTPQLGGNLDVNGKDITGDAIDFHAADGQVIAKLHKTNSSEFYFNNSKKLEVTNGGISVTGNVTPSSGIYLGGSGGSNHLNDYEEGTFTTTLKYNNSSDAGFSTSPTGGTDVFYTKIGRQVHVHGYIKGWTMTTGDGSNASITLPFAVSGGSNQAPGSVAHYTCFNHGTVRCLAEPSTSRLDFFQDNSTSRTTWSSGSSNYLMFGVTYHTDA